MKQSLHSCGQEEVSNGQGGFGGSPVTFTVPVLKLDTPLLSEQSALRNSWVLELFREGVGLVKRGKHLEALGFLNQILIEFPDIALNTRNLQSARAICLKGLKRFREAQIAATAELSFQPENSNCWQLLNDIRISWSKSKMVCGICNVEMEYFERQFNKDWYLCPNCNLLQYDVGEQDGIVLDKGESDGARNSTYSIENRREEFFCRLFLEGLNLRDVLSYGIGWSLTYQKLKSCGFNVVGCDLWRPLIEERKKEYGAASFYHRDDLPLIKFDLISAFEVFEHFIHPVREVSLMADRLKDEGAIVGCTDFWHGGSLENHPSYDKTYWKHGSHVIAWTWKSMNTVADRFGLNTHYFKTAKMSCPSRVFFIMYKGNRFEKFIHSLPKVFHSPWNEHSIAINDYIHNHGQIK